MRRSGSLSIAMIHNTFVNVSIIPGDSEIFPYSQKFMNELPEFPMIHGIASC
jgi:hypothetical protein